MFRPAFTWKGGKFSAATVPEKGKAGTGFGKGSRYWTLNGKEVSLRSDVVAICAGRLWKGEIPPRSKPATQKRFQNSEGRERSPETVRYV
jgi:hypothetical protein